MTTAHPGHRIPADQELLTAIWTATRTQPVTSEFDIRDTMHLHLVAHSARFLLEATPGLLRQSLDRLLSGVDHPAHAPAPNSVPAHLLHTYSSLRTLIQAGLNPGSLLAALGAGQPVDRAVLAAVASLSPVEVTGPVDSDALRLLAAMRNRPLDVIDRFAVVLGDLLADGPHDAEAAETPGE